MYNGHHYRRRRLSVSYNMPSPQQQQQQQQELPSCFVPHVRLETGVTAPVTQDFLYIDKDSDDFALYGRAPSGNSIFEDDSIYEHGRTYQGYRQGKYFLPNDGEEQDRLDLQHAALFCLLENKLYMAPVQHPENVLDIGTGT